MRDVMSRRMSVVIAGDLLGDNTPDNLRETILGTSDCATWGVLIPGLPVVEEVTVTRMADEPDGVVITATFVGHEVVQDGDYKGDAVTEDFVASYIMGAEAYWCGHGDEFFPFSVVAVQTL